MENATLINLALLYALALLALLVGVVRFMNWVYASERREHAFYAAVTGLTLSACASGYGDSRPFSNDFFSGPGDQHHMEWIARVKAEKL